MKNKKTLHGPGGIQVILDRSKYDRNDPGTDTPALVVLGKYTATLTCAVGEGELLGNSDVKILTESQCEWLASIEDESWEFLEGN